MASCRTSTKLLVPKENSNPRSKVRRDYLLSVVLIAVVCLSSSFANGDGAWTQFELERGVCNIASPYTPQLIQDEVLKSPGDTFRVFCRGVRMIAEFGYFWVCLKADEVLSNDALTTPRVKDRAAQLRELLTRLGPSFIKAGQVLANRPDIVREDFMNELCTLQDDVPPFSDDEVLSHRGLIDKGDRSCHI